MWVRGAGCEGCYDIIPKRVHSDASNCVIESKRPLTWKEKVAAFFALEAVETVQPPDPIPEKKTLILDLDETLIHSSEFDPHPDCECFKHLDGILNVMVRPGLKEFMEFCRDNFDVFIFTASSQPYADHIIDRIAPWIDKAHRHYRDSCLGKANTPLIKNINFLKRRKQDVIIVDDSSVTFQANPKNTLRIVKFNGMPTDKYLIDWLIPILEKCLAVDDVRKIIPEYSQ